MANTSLPPSGPSTASNVTLTAAARRPAGSASITRTARRFKSTSSPVFIEDGDDHVNRSHSAWDLARYKTKFFKFHLEFFDFEMIE